MGKKIWPNRIANELKQMALDGVSRKEITERINKLFGTTYTEQQVGVKIDNEHWRKGEAKKPLGRPPSVNIYLPKAVQEQPKPSVAIRPSWMEGCQWPLGDPRKGPLEFCGKKTFHSASSPYCNLHHKKAYIASNLRQRRA